VDISAPESVPPFDNSAVDGYAVQAADTLRASAVTPVALVVVGELAAGTAASLLVGSGRAIRIMTGAPIPPGADAIVMVEDTVSAGDGVLVRRPADVGDHIRPAGGDIRLGMPLFGAATVLTPAHLGVLASVGYRRVRVHHRPRVGVLSTGSELVVPGIPLTPGKIRDSNGPMLLALVAEAGCPAPRPRGRPGRRGGHPGRDQYGHFPMRRLDHERRRVRGRLRLRETGNGPTG